MSAQTTGGTGGDLGTSAPPGAPAASPPAAAARPAGQATGGGVLATEHGRTLIANSVVAKIVAMATREIGGVYEMGAGATRMMGTLRDRVPGARASVAQGVRVEVGEMQAAADIDLVLEYGVVIPDLADAVRRNVIRRGGTHVRAGGHRGQHQHR